MALFGTFELALATWALNPGILLTAKVEWMSRRDLKPNWVISEPVVVCRYLHLTGIAEKHSKGEQAFEDGCQRLRRN